MSKCHKVIKRFSEDIDITIDIKLSQGQMKKLKETIKTVAEELAYLYGFGQFDFGEDNIDSETMNSIMLFIGVMLMCRGLQSALKHLLTR